MTRPTPWLRITDLAAEHQVHPTTIIRLIEAGELEGYRIGVRQWRVRRAAWEAYLERRRVGPPMERPA
jgi:excisionase family DNA binding protein